MDSFLDLYAQWRQTHDPGLKDRIEGLVGEIKKLEPEFQFDVMRELYGGTDERKCA